MGKILYQSTLDIEDQKNLNWRSNTGEPNAWIPVSGKLILLNGIPSTGQVVIGYIQEPVQMVNDTDTPDSRIPEFVHQYLKYAAVAFLKQQAGQTQDLKMASEMYAKFTTGLGLGPMGLASRDVKR
jgi:hypothetical protein